MTHGDYPQVRGSRVRTESIVFEEVWCIIQQNVVMLTSTTVVYQIFRSRGYNL